MDLPCEIVVADWRSDDWPLEEWIHAAAFPVPVRLVEIDGKFSRGEGLNAAAAAAHGSELLFLDADCLIARTFLYDGLKHVDAGKAYFPILFSYANPEHSSGWWRDEGFGICMLSRNHFDQSGGWPEYKQWGKEDDHFHSRVKAIAPVARENAVGLFHQWHPNDVAWKDQYADVPAAVLEEREQVRLAITELTALIPADQMLVLIDEARFGVDNINGRRAIPFLESRGEYAGVPEDDEAAIRELSRLQAMGAKFLVVAWPAFWWLEIYSEFARHVESHFAQVFENERLKVYERHDASSGMTRGAGRLE